MEATVGPGTEGHRLGTSGPYVPTTHGQQSGSAFKGTGKTVAVLGAIGDRSQQPSDTNSAGDLVMSPRPAAIRYLADNDRFMYARWNIGVPARKRSAPLKQLFTVASSAGELKFLRALALKDIAH